MHNTVKDFIIALFYAHVHPHTCLGCFPKYKQRTIWCGGKEVGTEPQLDGSDHAPPSVLKPIVEALLKAGFSIGDIRAIHGFNGNLAQGEITDEDILAGRWQIGCMEVEHLIYVVQNRYPDPTA